MANYFQKGKHLKGGVNDHRVLSSTDVEISHYLVWYKIKLKLKTVPCCHPSL